MRFFVTVLALLAICLLEVASNQSLFLATSSAKESQPKRLILCMDGTWNNPTIKKTSAKDIEIFKPTNVLKTCRGVKEEAADGTLQISYYATGVGAYRTYDAKWNKTVTYTDRIFGGARGAGYEQIVDEAYRFLQMNYEPGDEIYLFGFSRGAAVARTLADLIHYMGGILDKQCGYFLPEYFAEFLRHQAQKAEEEENGRKYSKGDKKAKTYIEKHQEIRRRVIAKMAKKKHDDTLCEGKESYPGVEYMVHKDARINYMGLWDTVVELGGERDSFMVSKKPPSNIDHIRHAVAIDERRKNFKPWVFEGLDNCQDCPNTVQRWFPGVHANVGGGYDDDMLANVALLWVLRGIEENGLKLEFRDEYLKFYENSNPWIGPIYNSKVGFWNYLESGFQFWKPKGDRSLFEFKTGESSTNLELHPLVIRRLASDSPYVMKNKNKDRVGEVYRPKHLMAYLCKEKDLDAYLEKTYPDGTRFNPDGVAEKDPSKVRSDAKRIIEDSEHKYCRDPK